ncbi:hypothetical protein [Silvanigrella aquatica]|uniref:Uncharacterized protein n=1 Tax=Silvanigrella aquatica TaxID=1915309 RepID=A0A1L4CXV4_9BACT|nr:hypothetical protein [Silvanigrella aquatica]APJ02770.1 hypothetical protein AXG55_02050 [Silvanigrella aquatica]
MKLTLKVNLIIATAAFNSSIAAHNLDRPIVNLRVYCADSNGNWNWLKTNDRFETLNGFWNTSQRSCKFNMTDYQSDSYSYFIALGGEQEINKLVTACRKKFTTLATPYVYYVNGSSSWFPIASHENRILNGRITIKSILPTSFIPIKSNLNFDMIYPNKLFITKSDISNDPNCFK